MGNRGAHLPTGRIRRYFLHLTRQRARVALLVAGSAIALYAVMTLAQWPVNANVRDPIQQILLILTGTAASAVFLPELSSDLWNLKAVEIRRLIPTEKRAALARSLIEAESAGGQSEWDKLIYEQALVPLIAASHEPSQMIRNMSYSVQAHLNEEFDQFAESTTTVHYHAVQTLSRSERVFPQIGEDQDYWISAARTVSALHQEFRNPNCVAREVVSLFDSDGHELSAQLWREAVVQLCTVGVNVNGETQRIMREVRSPRRDEPSGTPDSTPDSRTGSATLPVVEAGEDYNEDIVRWRFRPAEEDLRDRVPVQIAFDFPMVREDRFLVYFNYYCAGATSVSMKVFNLSPTAGLRCDAFFGRAKRSETRNEEEHVQGLLATQRSISTGRDSLLWPGSGALFSWHECG